MLGRAQAANPDADLRQADANSLPFDDISSTYSYSSRCSAIWKIRSPASTRWRGCSSPAARCIATATPLFNLNGYAVVNRAAPLVPFVRLTQLKQFFTTGRTLRSHFREAGFGDIRVHGVYIGPINWIERLFPGKLRDFLRRGERLDRRLADVPIVREFSNMFLVTAVRSR